MMMKSNTVEVPERGGEHAGDRSAPTDQFGRTIDYVRISLTDVCNLRCTYCMPENMVFSPPKELLQDDEIMRAIQIFDDLGFRKIRFTGGEPTLRKNLVNIVTFASSRSSVQTVGMTTNGILLEQLARPLREAGLSRVNISLDTLDADRFRRITRWGSVGDVLAGIRSAEKAGLGIKINCVVMRGHNDGNDLVELADLSIGHKWQIRFIEMMPFARVSDFQQSHTISEDTVRKRISASLGPLRPINNGCLDGEASVWQLEGAKGTVGFISPVSRPFCGSCNRIRLTADGMLRLCLLRANEFDFKNIMRSGSGDDFMKEAILKAIHDKPIGHELKEKKFAQNRTMSEIGG